MPAPSGDVIREKGAAHSLAKLPFSQTLPVLAARPRIPGNDRNNAARVFVFNDYGHDAAIVPQIAHETLDFGFPAAKTMCLAGRGLQNESFEIAEMVVNQAR